MFFEKEILSFHILDVLELKQNQFCMVNRGRNYNALSFRFRSDAILKTETAETRMGDGYVSYVPARLDYNREGTTDELIAIHFDTTNYHTKQIECFLPKDPEPIARLFREILSCWCKKEPGYLYKCSALLHEILGECYLQNYVAPSAHSKIQPSVDHLLQHYKESDLSIKELADKSFMSEVYFRKLFKEEYGVSPQKYIIGLRIQNAVGLIGAGYYSLKEVADLSGYNDYKYFSVEFKKIMGVSPSEYLYNYRE